MTDHFEAPETADEARDELRDAGITKARLDAFETNVEQTIDAQLATYDEYVDLDTAEQAAVVVAVQDDLLRSAVAAGWRESNGVDVATWFERFADDFTDPDSNAARSGVALVVGKLAARDDEPDAVTDLSNAMMVRNYEQASGNGTDH